MASIGTLAAPMQHILIDAAEAAARATGCVVRQRAFSGATLVQTLVLGFWQAPDASLSTLCQLAAARGVTISPQGLAERFTPALAATLEAVLAQVVQQAVAGDPVALPVLQRFRHVWVLDTSTVSLPVALAACWPGCGGRPGEGEAAVKLAVELDLVTGLLHGPVLQAGRTPDRTTPLLERARPAGSLTIRDLGFFRLEQLAAEQAAGGHWLTRAKANVVITTPDGVRQTQVALLARTHAAVVDVPIQLGARLQLPARLIAVRVGGSQAQQRRRRLRREARKKGQVVSTDRLALAAWDVVITNLPAAALSVAEALALLRARWAIEQLFDLWKTHAGLDRSRSAQPWRILAEVYAKLIALVLQHWLLVHGDWTAPAHSLVKAAAAMRRLVALLASALDRRAALHEALAHIHRVLLGAGRLNTRKHRPNLYQRLLDPDRYALT